MASKMAVKDLPSDTVVCIGASVLINAPATKVFDILMRTSTWPEWNSFCPSVETARPEEPLEMGTKMNLQVQMTPDSALRGQKVIVTEVTVGDESEASVNRVRWTVQGFPNFVLRTNRTTEIERRGASCEYRSWEIMAGPAAYTVKAMYNSALQARFEDMANDLKKYAETISQDK